MQLDKSDINGTVFQVFVLQALHVDTTVIIKFIFWK